MTDQYNGYVRFAGSYSKNEITFSFGSDTDPVVASGIAAAIKAHMTSLPNVEAQSFTKTESVISNF